MRKTIRGFTIIELLVVIAVIGILATIGLVSFARIQSDSRDSQRSSRITTIAESLEKYFEKNGTYPSCDAMAATPSTVTTTTLKGLDPSVLTAPKATSGTNSILAACADLSTTDAYAYRGGGCTANGCLQYTLKYLEESTSNPVSLLSRHRIPPPNLPTNLVAVTASSTSINLSWDAVSGANNYTVQYDTNSSFTGPTSTITASSPFTSSSLSQGTLYYYRVNATNENGASGWSTTANATTTIDAPAAPVVTANTVLPTTTWSWPAVTCASGTTDRYQYRYTITPSGYDSGWVAIATSPVAFTTSTGGQTYTVQVQAQCYSTYTTSSWGATGSASYIPVSYTLAISAGAGGTVNTAVNGIYISGDTPTITATPNANYAFSSWTGGGNCAGVASHTITMNANQTCVANFVATYVLTISANTGGTVNTAVNGTYNSGSTPTITATPNSGSAFVSWTGGGNCAGVASHTILMNANQTCVANFNIYQLVGTIGVASQSAVGTALTPAWGTSETRAASNLLVCFVAVSASATIPTTPSGWSVAKTQAGTTSSVAIFYKIAAGSDAAPTIAAISSAYISAQLAEFSGGSHSSPLDKVGSASGTSSPRVETASATDTNSFGELIITANTIYYSAAATKTLTDTINNATKVTTNNAETSTRWHYDFTYGYATTNSTADSDSFAFTTTSITGQAGAIASFKN